MTLLDFVCFGLVLRPKGGVISNHAMTKGGVISNHAMTIRINQDDLRQRRKYAHSTQREATGS